MEKTEKKNALARWLSREFGEDITNARAAWITTSAISFAILCTIGASNIITAIISLGALALSAFKAGLFRP